MGHGVSTLAGISATQPYTEGSRNKKTETTTNVRGKAPEVCCETGFSVYDGKLHPWDHSNVVA